MDENREPAPRTTEYRSFILRLWRNNPAQPAGWQVSLLDAQTGRNHGFASLEELFAFLIDLDQFLQKQNAELRVNPLERGANGNGAKDRSQVESA